MPERIEARLPPTDVMAKILARHAAALHVVFMRTFVDVLAKRDRSLRDVSRALKAQHQSRTALRLLIKLRAVEQFAAKIAKSNEQTIERGNSPS